MSKVMLYLSIDHFLLTRTTLTTADVRLDIMSPSVFNGDSWLNVFRSDPLLPDLQLTQSSSLNMAALFEFLQESKRYASNACGKFALFWGPVGPRRRLGPVGAGFLVVYHCDFGLIGWYCLPHNLISNSSRFYSK